MSSSQPPFNRVKRPAEAPIWASSKRGRESVKAIEIDGLPPHISSKLVETIRVAKTFVENHEDDAAVSVSVDVYDVVVVAAAVDDAHAFVFRSGGILR